MESFKPGKIAKHNVFTGGYRTPEHVPTKEAFEAVGDTFLVDYVRVFDIVKK